MHIREWLDSLRMQGMKLGLENTAELLSRMDNPQNKFPSIHVAGSNGKGTVCSILANTFSLNGIKTGLFTSPHLCNVEERIRIDGKQISEKELSLALEKLRFFCEKTPKITPTFYEATFLSAMIHFSISGVQRAIIETGLGGRLDATRLVKADCCVLTRISLEHTEILGSTLVEIAKEKSAIARPGVPLVSIWVEDILVRNQIIKSTGTSKLVKWYKPDSNQKMKDEAIGLANLVLSSMNLTMTSNEAARLTIWPGRMQIIQYSKELEILLDSAHNPSGMFRAFEEISRKNKKIETLIFGCTLQLDLQNFLQPLINSVQSLGIRNIILTEPQEGRTESLSVEVLFQKLSYDLVGIEFVNEKSPIKAFQKAKSLTNKGTLLCIGSLYLIGNILSILKLDDGDSMNILSESKN